jgi:hypothetical protein
MISNDRDNHENNNDEPSRIQSIIFNILIFIMIVIVLLIIIRLLWWFSGPRTMLFLAFNFYIVGIVALAIGGMGFGVIGHNRGFSILATGFSSKHPVPVGSSSKFEGPNQNRETKIQSPVVEMKKKVRPPVFPILLCCAGAVCILIGGLIHFIYK